MELDRIKQLAGLPETAVNRELRLLTEVVEIPEDITMDQLIERLDACKRALSLVHKLKDPADKKKWMSATFVNLNKVRGALQRMLAKLEMADNATGGDVLKTNQLTNDVR